MTEYQPTIAAAYPARTTLDLDGALAKFQLDADYICMIAEDLPDNALEERCKVLFGEDGDFAVQLIVEIVNLAAGDDAAFEKAVAHAFEDSTD